MVAIETETRNGVVLYRVSFKTLNGKRRRLRLQSGTTKRDAKIVAAKVEELVSARSNNGVLSQSILEWLSGVSIELRRKLRDAELLPHGVANAIERFSISEWFDTYLRERSDIKPSTREQIKIAGADLARFFGKDLGIDRITAADAKRWRTWMLTSGKQRGKGKAATDGKKSDDAKRDRLSEETVRRRTGRAKQVFGEALERGYIVLNPFERLPSASRANTTRQCFVDHQTIQTVINSAPPGDWRVIIALARYGGLRIPSELSTLRWDDVNLPQRKMTIRAPKTEHHRDGGIRVCPIFPELFSYLQEAWESAPDGAVYVIESPKKRSAKSNLGTELKRIIERAGVVPWPKSFQNLRASRETELLARFPAKDVAAWLGNSVPVAMKHYAMATAEQFERASFEVISPRSFSGGEVGEQGGEITVPNEDSASTNFPSENDNSPRIAGYCVPLNAAEHVGSSPARTRT